MIKSHESVSIEIERILKKLIHQQQQFGLELIAHPELDVYLNQHDKDYLLKLAEKSHADLR
jgi:ribonuclease G